jgi:hypothetical protein
MDVKYSFIILIFVMEVVLLCIDCQAACCIVFG